MIVGIKLDNKNNKYYITDHDYAFVLQCNGFPVFSIYHELYYFIKSEKLINFLRKEGKIG